MFTGIIEELGTIKEISSAGGNALLKISCKRVLDDVKNGDSIAVNGICLTVTSFGKDFFSADISSETLSRTSLKSAAAGTSVNLERALPANGRFGGHIVLGHVDGIGTVLEISASLGFRDIRVAVPENLRKYISEKGSITVDGVSLTVAGDHGEWIDIAVIPHTFNQTVLCGLKPGSAVNIEVDVLARYIGKLLENKNKDDKLLDLLRKM